MTRTTFLYRTLRYHWRTNLAVLLGVVAGTAVVGGALIVGDSVRGSLRDMTLARLGEVDHVLHGQRFFRENLATELAALSAFKEQFAAAAPVIVLPASVEHPTQGVDNQASTVTRAGSVNLYGVDDRMWNLTEHREVLFSDKSGLVESVRSGSIPAPRDREVIVSHRLAQQLEVKPGDEVVLLVELPSAIPRDSLLGKRDQTAMQIPVTVATVLEERSGVGRFGLQPDQQLPLNAFVSLAMLQDRLGLAAREPTRRQPRRGVARVNALLVAAKPQAGRESAGAVTAAGELTGLLARVWRLDDFNLRVVSNARRNYLSLESERMILDKTVVAAAERVADQLQVASSPVLVSLANELTADKGGKAFSMYSVVAGVDPQLLTPSATPPFGPFEFAGEPLDSPLGEGDILQGGIGEIVLNDWLAKDLQANPGDVVRLKYHVVGSRGELPEEERRFKVRGVVKLDGTVADDRGLTPEVPGITDAANLGQWEQPFEMKLERVTDRDEAYWEGEPGTPHATGYRATPKAFVTLKTARHLWQSRYGDLTSFRFAPVPGKPLEESAALFTAALLQELKPADLGMVFQPVKYRGLAAASGTTDFGGLFIGFSFFLILSAMILIGLLFRLGIERRGTSVGLLLATGFSKKQVRRLLLSEGALVVAAGGALGLFAAIAYAAIMVHGLKTWWVGAIGTRFLDLHVERLSLLIGFAIAVGIALAAVWWGLRVLSTLSERGLLAGVTQQAITSAAQRHRSRFATRLSGTSAGVAVVLSVGVVTGIIPNREAFSGFSWPTISFFVVGLAALAAGLALLSAWLDSDRSAAVRGSGFWGVGRLGLRNAARHRSRSVLTAGLIASATFLIVAIAAAHRNPAAEAPDRNSGNGGFTLVAESPVPILNDLNTPAGRAKLDLADADSAKTLQPLRQVVPFRVNPGENASCLNIYQTSQPTILGVPQDMIERGGFKFAGSPANNPWTLLDARDERDIKEPGRAAPEIPVLGDMNTLMYSLHAGPGAMLEIRDEENRPVKVRIAGMLDGSVFQGVLLMSERHFQKLFPSRVGYRYFLLDIDPQATQSARAISDLLETKLPGFDAEPVAVRLASFLAVQNTYLSTFQTLGGLGLLLGTIGLATVMLRNVLERRSELALLRAVGFRDHSLAWLVLWENALLLTWGLAAGALSALLAMLPHLLSTGADVPWSSTGITLSAVFLAGMAAAWLAIRAAVRTPVLATLRSE